MGRGRAFLVEIALIALCGGVLGVLFMIPLRQALIVKEHGVLPYPEGQACAEVLIAGEQGGSKAGVVFAGMGIAALYKFVADGLKLFPSDVDYDIQKYGGGVGISVLPALCGSGLHLRSKDFLLHVFGRYYIMVDSDAHYQAVRKRTHSALCTG